jgi:integrase
MGLSTSAIFRYTPSKSKTSKFRTVNGNEFVRGFLFKRVLERDDLVINAIHAKTPQRLPIVLSSLEVAGVLNAVSPRQVQLMVALMYGCGLRVIEACRLRVKDVDFQRSQIIVRDGKGNKDRVGPLPKSLALRLARQTDYVAKLHSNDLECISRGGVCHPASTRANTPWEPPHDASWSRRPIAYAASRQRLSR